MLDDLVKLEVTVGVARLVRRDPVATAVMNHGVTLRASPHKSGFLGGKQWLGTNKACLSLEQIINQLIDNFESGHGEQ